MSGCIYFLYSPEYFNVNSVTVIVLICDRSAPSVIRIYFYQNVYEIGIRPTRLIDFDITVHLLYERQTSLCQNSNQPTLFIGKQLNSPPTLIRKQIRRRMNVTSPISFHKSVLLKPINLVRLVSLKILISRRRFLCRREGTQEHRYIICWGDI